MKHDRPNFENGIIADFIPLFFFVVEIKFAHGKKVSYHKICLVPSTRTFLNKRHFPIRAGAFPKRVVRKYVSTGALLIRIFRVQFNPVDYCLNGKHEN